jgi:hypothetical protein
VRCVLRREKTPLSGATDRKKAKKRHLTEGMTEKTLTDLTVLEVRLGTCEGACPSTCTSSGKKGVNDAIHPIPPQVPAMISRLYTLKLRGQTRQSWREARGQRIRVRVKHKTGALREKKKFHLGKIFLARRTTRQDIWFTAIRLVVFMHQGMIHH